MFRGREQTHPERGRDLLMRLAEDVKDLGTIESPPIQDGRNMVMVLAPHKTSAGKWEQLRVPKQKTNSAAKKRFKITGTGRILRRHAMKSHNLEKKSAKRAPRVSPRPARGRARRPRGQAPARAVAGEGGSEMPRVKRSVHARKKRRKVLERAKGYVGQSSISYRKAKEAVQKADNHAYRDRKQQEARLPAALDRADQRGRPPGGPLLQPVRVGLPEGRDRARPQGARGHRGQRSRRRSRRSRSGRRPPSRPEPRRGRP